jgi:hypothetical protein
MSKGKQAFKETDVARAHRAAQKANLRNYTLRITRDALEFRVGEQESLPDDDGGPPNSFDQVLGTR